MSTRPNPAAADQGTIPRQLGAILDVLGLEWASLFDKNAAEDRNKVVAWLYRILDTLDSKTGHLLSFNALLLAAQTFLAGQLIGSKQTPHCISITVLLLLVFPLTGGVLGFRVFDVKWRFFGKDTIREEIQELAKICDLRFNAHRNTFRMCWVSTLAFIATLVMALIVYWPPAQK
jgi:hypothetical protein